MRTGNYMTQDRVLVLVAAANGLREILKEVRAQTRGIAMSVWAGETDPREGIVEINNLVQRIDSREISMIETVLSEQAIFNQSRVRHNERQRNYMQSSRAVRRENEALELESADDSRPKPPNARWDHETDQGFIPTKAAIVFDLQTLHQDLANRNPDGRTNALFIAELLASEYGADYHSQVTTIKRLETSQRIVRDGSDSQYRIAPPEANYSDEEPASDDRFVFGRRTAAPSGENKAGTGSTTSD